MEKDTAAKTRLFNEKDFIAQVEAADTEKLADILRDHTREEEEALRAYLGAERYQRMHSMALRRNKTRGGSKLRGPDPDRGNVVVIHGIMGAELTATDRAGSGDQVWVKALRIMRGWIERLRLADDGREPFGDYEVHASGIMKRYYGELLLALSDKWNVRAFWYDWRKDLQNAASELETKIDAWFGDGKPVHLVAHSMGGLVARTFIGKYPSRWKSMWDEKGNGRRGGRLVMLGTPNYGSFAIPQTFMGVEGMVRKLALLDVRHSLEDILNILNSFVGSYQMLPSPYVMTKMEELYTAGTYGHFNVSQRHLDTARKHHEYLAEVVDEARMIYVAGYDQPTFSNISDFKKIGSLEGYDVTMDGDGRVPHLLGILRRGDKQVGDVYYIKADHGNLASNATILAALPELLENGKTKRLATELPANRSTQKRGSKEDLLIKVKKAQQEDEQQLDLSLRRMRSSRTSAAARAARSRGAAAVEDSEVDIEAMITSMSPEERKVEERLTSEFLGTSEELGSNGAEAEQPESEPDAAGQKSDRQRPTVEIGLEFGGIESIDYDRIRSSKAQGGFPIDAVSVGHYIGVQPQQAEEALDKAISIALVKEQSGANLSKSERILTQYTNRGIIHGKLGQPFFLPDPRPNKTGRVIALAGMDEPGRFGTPELTVLVRELCWSLGRQGKRHLATVAIGAGVGNLSLRDCIPAWMDGIQRAISGSRSDDYLRRVTFVEYDASKVRLLDKAISDFMQEEEKREESADDEYDLVFKYTPLSEELKAELKEKAYEKAQSDLQKTWSNEVDSQEVLNSLEPSRVTLSLDAPRKTYKYGAITATASVPEREIRIDPNVVNQANDELAGEENLDLQLERGRFLEELLIPDDLRRQLYNRAPLVMLLDSTTARIHWEMVAQPELIMIAGSAEGTENKKFDKDRFLGTSRGFTRQLRTVLAPPPEPPPPPRRVLRVLVVADPAEDAPLEGAQEEGEAVANIFESYNTIYKGQLNETRVEVTRLFGPVVATRTNVLRELMVRQYDVLHFAGHCIYDEKDPSNSGWIFNEKRNERLTANELNRIDRIPKFVFSNACESGITPDRSSKRSVDLAPSFAEAFFMRGVANFVCTAWPVDDLAAQTFSLKLYSGLLGIGINDKDGSFVKGNAKPMHSAMREARIAIATKDGANTWGAYQHYGNPYFALFSTRAAETKDDTKGGSKKGGAKKSGSKKATGRSSKQTAARRGPTAAAGSAATKTRGAAKKAGRRSTK